MAHRSLRGVAFLLDYAPQIWTSPDDYYTGLSRALKREGAVPLVVFSGPIGTEIGERYRACGAEIEIVNFEDGMYNYFSRLHRILRQHPIDLVYIGFFNYFDPISWIAFFAGAPRIVFYEQNSGMSRSRSWRKVLVGIRARAMTLPVNRFLAISEFKRQVLGDVGIPETNISVVHGGVDVRRFSPDPAARNYFADRFHIDSGEVILSTISFFRTFKRTDVLVKACALLAARNVPVRLVVAGDGPLRPELERLAETLGIGKTVHWLGRFSRPDKLLQGSDIFALASEGEAFGLVLAEAQACQVRVVGSRSGSIPEVIEDGTTGILANPGDPASFADAVERLARDPALRRGMGAQGRERVLKRFTSDLAVRRTTDLCRALYEGHPDVNSSPTAG